MMLKKLLPLAPLMLLPVVLTGQGRGVEPSDC